MSAWKLNSEIPATEAAVILGVSRERVIRLIQVGKLKGRRDGDLGWRVAREGLEPEARDSGGQAGS